MSVELTFHGPLFTKANAIIDKHLGSAGQELMERGEARLGERLRPRPAGVYLSVSEAAPGKASAGHYRRNVTGQRNGLDFIIHDNNVVYGPWLEGLSSRNETTRFKGYRSFRQTEDELNREAPSILDKHAKRAARELEGR